MVEGGRMKDEKADFFSGSNIVYNLLGYNNIKR